MKYELDGTGLFADGRTILFPGGNRDVKAIAELVRRANAYDGLLEACKQAGHPPDVFASIPSPCSCSQCTKLRAAISSSEGGAK